MNPDTSPPVNPSCDPKWAKHHLAGSRQDRSPLDTRNTRFAYRPVARMGIARDRSNGQVYENSLWLLSAVVFENTSPS